ncbi:C-type lectin domain family 4 member G-like isoform X2 [Micropterus salmoides]|uniref:C-type lectin domain family 4 member G-like isoform X2 n=1 Tax=Micropterus salmoides TaxID=27706 RepID=UPI0018EC39A3|nr:C-type lectin domain family 4 member G-like isoform X2 [Micropterus salmoides]
MLCGLTTVVILSTSQIELNRRTVAMAEEEVSYASVVFKTNKRSPPEANKEEETVYSDVKVRSKTTEKTADTNTGLLPDKKTNSRGRCYQQVACCLGILCVILLLGIIAVCVYIVTFIHESEPNQLKENQTILLALNGNLTNQNNKLSSENEKLRREHNNLTVQLENLTQAYTVLKSNITNLSAENQNLTSQNTKLSAENQNLTSQNTKLSAENQNLTSQNTKLSAENQNLTSQNTKQLETERNNLTEQIRNMETKWNELNVSRAQWSIDAYCPKPQNQNRTCKACQDGWTLSESSCYAINNPDVPGQKTWEEARENCRGKISDLVVKLDQKEKEYVNFNWGSYGYWIGQRAEAGNWTWINGTFLKTQDYLTGPPSGEAHCVISVGGTPSKSWKAVKCDEKHRWICEKKALSV